MNIEYPTRIENSVTTNSSGNSGKSENSENFVSVILFGSISMTSLLTNLNPSATTFICGRNIHSDLDYVEMINNTNAFEMNKENCILIFMAFILILSVYIVNVISMSGNEDVLPGSKLVGSEIT